MRVETQQPDMENGRALLTERERDAIRGEKSDSYRYKTRTYLRSRFDELAADVDLLREQEPELYDELQRIVAADGDRQPDSTPAEAVENADQKGSEPVEESAGDTAEPMTVAVENAADGWADDGRLESRKAAARAVIEYARENGTISQEEAKEKVYPDNPVSGQDARTWYRKTIRPVLNEAAEYDNSARAYRLVLDSDE
jgi:hypothetical protein